MRLINKAIYSNRISLFDVIIYCFIFAIVETLVICVTYNDSELGNFHVGVELLYLAGIIFCLAGFSTFITLFPSILIFDACNGLPIGDRLKLLSIISTANSFLLITFLWSSRGDFAWGDLHIALAFYIAAFVDSLFRTSAKP